MAKNLNQNLKAGTSTFAKIRPLTVGKIGKPTGPTWGEYIDKKRSVED
jgi:hypothetical protein